MVKVKKFSNWLEHRDEDMFIIVKNTIIDEGLRNWFVKKIHGTVSAGNQDTMDITQVKENLIAGIIAWVQEKKDAIAVNAGAKDDPAMEGKLYQVVNRVVPALIRRGTVFGGVDKSDAPSQFAVDLNDAKFLADYIIGIKHNQPVPPDVTPPHHVNDPDMEYPHHEADDSLFRGGNPATIGEKIHGPTHPAVYPDWHPIRAERGQTHPEAGLDNPDEGRPIRGRSGENRLIQSAAATLALQNGITNPSRVINELIQTFPRELKRPSNWGRIAGIFSTNYTAYFLPQVRIGIQRTLISAGQTSQQITDLARVARNSPMPAGDPNKRAVPSVSHEDYFKAQAKKWFAENGGKPLSSGILPGSALASSAWISFTLDQVIEKLRYLGGYLMSFRGGYVRTKAGKEDYKWSVELANIIAEYIRNTTTKLDSNILNAIVDELDLEKFVMLNLREDKGLFSPGNAPRIKEAILDGNGQPKQSFKGAVS